MRAYFPDGSAVECRRDLVLELLPAERLELRDRPAHIDVVECPDGDAPDLVNGIVLNAIGRYWLRVDNTDLHLVCFEQTVLVRISEHTRPIGHGAVDPRGVVRNLCNSAPWFDGTLACLMTGDPARSLAKFGA